MNSITSTDFSKKIKKHEGCRNGEIREHGKPTIVWAEYNGRRYEWILQD